MIKVYHGSIQVVESPLVMMGRDNLDFGRGFYVTDLWGQAVSWAERIARRRLAAPIISVYEFDRDEAMSRYCYLRFDAYDKPWLDFIADSRNGNRPWQQYDVIEGGVANDNVIDTVQDYLNGRMSAEAALAELSKHQPNNQLCILNQKVVDRYLRFVESVKL